MGFIVNTLKAVKTSTHRFFAGIYNYFFPTSIAPSKLTPTIYPSSENTIEQATPPNHAKNLLLQFNSETPESDYGNKKTIRLCPQNVTNALIKFFQESGMVQKDGKYAISNPKNEKKVLVCDATVIGLIPRCCVTLPRALKVCQSNLIADPTINRCIIPIGETSQIMGYPINHFVVLVIERDQTNNGFSATVVDSKATSAANRDDNIKECLTETFKQVIPYTRYYTGQQGVFDNTSCGYYMLKTIKTLCSDLASNVTSIIPSASLLDFYSENWLTTKEINDINATIPRPICL